MRHTVTFVILALAAASADTPVFAADVVAAPAQVITTDRVDFAPGGTIRIDGSYGVLNIEGWDKPEVEITFTKSRPLRFGESPSPDRDKSRLDSIQLKNGAQILNGTDHYNHAEAPPSRLGSPFWDHHNRRCPRRLRYSRSPGFEAANQTR
jgi:hypothetical protein